MKALLGSRALIVSVVVLLAGTIIPFMIWGDALETAFSVQGARAWMAGYGAGAGVARVRVSPRLVKSPAVVVSSQHGWNANMERIMKAQALAANDAGARAAQMRGGRTLEVNPRHGLVRRLRGSRGSSTCTLHQAELSLRACGTLSRRTWRVT